MTFAVVQVGGGGTEKIVGTIWASGESEAERIICDLHDTSERESLVIRRAEEREIPMRMFN